MILTPAPYGSNKKSAHIAISLHASPNFKNFTPRGGKIASYCYNSNINHKYGQIMPVLGLNSDITDTLNKT